MSRAASPREPQERLRLLAFGFGYSARAVHTRLRPRIAAAWGTQRQREAMPAMRADAVTPLLFDGTSMSAELAGALGEATHVLVSIPPAEDGDPVLLRCRGALAEAKPRALVYLSTIGVYGDHGGAWVDETSACRPVTPRSRRRLAVEGDWRRFSERSGVPVAILRLAGIYGPGRSPFERLREGTAQRVVKPGQVFNRIHVDDVAAIVEAAFARRAAGIFNGADDEPAPPQDVVAHAAALLGVPAPPETTFEAADLSPMARSFYGENKRVRNDRIKRALGIRLAYPTYREGLAAILAAEAS
jgi:dTDP-4-dehydrorhamnose reductase